MRPRSIPLAISIVLFLSLIGPLAPPASAQEGAFAISGRVLSDEGAPLPGVRVSGWSDSGNGDRGSYSSDDTLTDEDGAYTLHLNAGKGWVNVWYDEWRASDGRDLAIEGDVADLDFTLKTPPPKTAVITGVVTDEAGNAVAGASVDVWRYCCDDSAPMPATDGGGADGSGGASSTPPSEPQPETSDARLIAPYYPYDDGARATTDSDGRYTLTVYGGAYQLNVMAKGFAQETTRVDAVADQTVTADVTLIKVPAADAVLKGRVVDAVTGAPLNGAWVNLNHLEWGRYASAQTRTDGSFEITTIPGWVQISVSHYGSPDVVATDDGVTTGGAEPAIGISKPAFYGREQYYSHTSTMKLASGENADDIELQPKPQPTHVIIGYAVDPDAQTGIPNAHISFWNQDTGDWGSVTTDATGSYKITVRPGHYQVTGWAQGHLNGAANLVVSEGDATTRFDLTMPAGTTRQAPCYEDDGSCGYYPEYATMRDGDAKTATASSPPAPGADPRAAGPESFAEGDDAASTLGATGAASWQGEGGGLPPYDPNGADTTAQGGGDGASGGTRTPGSGDNVPGIGLLAGLAALGAVALMLRRKK